MPTLTDALLSQQEAGKITASIDPGCGRLSLSRHQRAAPEKVRLRTGGRKAGNLAAAGRSCIRA
jgi:hypothetical protein